MPDLPRPWFTALARQLSHADCTSTQSTGAKHISTPYIHYMYLLGSRFPYPHIQRTIPHSLYMPLRRLRYILMINSYLSVLYNSWSGYKLLWVELHVGLDPVLQWLSTFEQSIPGGACVFDITTPRFGYKSPTSHTQIPTRTSSSISATTRSQIIYFLFQRDGRLHPACNS